MSTRSSYREGQFCWAELVAVDAQKVKDFYKSFLDWEFEDNPVSENMVYTMAKYQGKYVCAMFTMNDDMNKNGVPPHWGQYISTTQIEDTVGSIEKFGGKVINKPFDVFNAGRMAICQDSEGATFNLWQPKEHIGAQIVNENNCWGWSEHTSWDIEKTKKFYSDVFNWTYENPDGEGKYFIIKNGPEMNGGVIDAKSNGLPSQIPANWGTYFTVPNLRAAIDSIIQNKGEIINPPMDAEGVGKFAVVKDPQGAVFHAIELLSEPTD